MAGPQGGYGGGIQEERRGQGYGANPYAAENGARSGERQGNGYPDEKKGQGYGANPYGAENGARTSERQGGGYGPNPYGAQGGYGGDRYASSSEPSAGGSGSRYGVGGYGGLGPTPSNNAEADGDRDALFGGARERVQQRNQQDMGYNGMGSPPPYEEGDGVGARPQEPSYEPYGDRQLTAEEEEEEDVTAMKQQMRFIKQSDVSSTRNALRIANQALETGENTLARLGAQGERIHNTEKNLDLMAYHNRAAEDKTRELKKLNRSMFRPTGSPFGSSARIKREEKEVLDRTQADRAVREATSLNKHRTDRRMEDNFKDLASNRRQGNSETRQAQYAERAKYQCEVRPSPFSFCSILSACQVLFTLTHKMIREIQKTTNWKLKSRATWIIFRAPSRECTTWPCSRRRRSVLPLLSFSFLRTTDLVGKIQIGSQNVDLERSNVKIANADDEVNGTQFLSFSCFSLKIQITPT